MMVCVAVRAVVLRVPAFLGAVILRAFRPEGPYVSIFCTRRLPEYLSPLCPSGTNQDLIPVHNPPAHNRCYHFPRELPSVERRIA